MLKIVFLQLALAENWAVFIESSRNWQNYRHGTNTLGLHQILVKNGVPESNIILLLAHDYACDCRNPEPGSMYYDYGYNDLYSSPYIQVDYSAEAVTGDLVLDLLTNQQSPYTPRRLRLDTSPDANVLVFLTGHSGVDFMKFQDFKELRAAELADAFKDMHRQKRFKGLFWIADTCKAESIHENFEMPDFIAMASSMRDQNSYGLNHERRLGLINADQFSYHSTKYLNSTRGAMDKTIADYLRVMKKKPMASSVNIRSDKFGRELNQVKLGEFMSSVDKWIPIESVLIPRPMPLTLPAPKPVAVPAKPVREIRPQGGLKFGMEFWAVFGCVAILPVLSLVI